MDDEASGRASASRSAEREREPTRNHALTAALLGGAVGGAVGAVWSARAIARKNGTAPLNAVMKTAATACELAHSHAASDGGG